MSRFDNVSGVHDHSPTEFAKRDAISARIGLLHVRIVLYCTLVIDVVWVSGQLHLEKTLHKLIKIGKTLHELIKIGIKIVTQLDVVIECNDKIDMTSTTSATACSPLQLILALL